MLILDTDLLTIVQRREGAVYHQLDARLEEASDKELIGVTIISFEEQTRGWLAYIAKTRASDRQVDAYARLHLLLRDFSNRQVLDFDSRAASEYDRLLRAKVRIGTMDLKIAAIALANKATLLSRNLADFKVKNLSLPSDLTLDRLEDRREVLAAVDLTHLIDRHDVGMLQPRDGLGFQVKALHVIA